MKYSVIALLAIGVEARNLRDASLIQESVEGIDKKTLQPDRHWNLPWPQGIDDSTDDDKILNWMRKPKAPEPPIQYHDKMRQWQEGTCPVYHTWNKAMDHATQHEQIDDGTDDNEVLNVQQKADIGVRFY